MTASDHSELHSAQPLLSDFSTSKKTALQDQSNVSFRSLEDGSTSSDSGSEFGDLRRPQGFWQRLRMSMRRRNGRGRHGDGFVSVRLGDDKRKSQKFRWRRRTLCAFLSLPVLALCVFGVLHIFNYLLGYVPLFWDDPANSIDWTLPDDVASHLIDITRDVTPIPCHSHNDYWRRVPLYDALRWGCTGVEADVWLFDEDLFVGHSTIALTQNRTFRTMYVDPLVRMLDHKNEPNGFPSTSPAKNGVFDTKPEQTLVLLVDFKNDGRDIFPYVSQQLSALREKGYLTYYNGQETIDGAITVVATGNAPFDMITANETYRDIFFDAPLASLYKNPASTTKLSTRGGGQGTVGTLPTSHFDSTNSYYASVNFGSAIGFIWWGSLSSKQLDLVRGQIKGAHSRGLKARYWSGPTWPIGLRNRIWNLLVEEGVDYLNGDDLRGMTRVDWGVKRHRGLIGH